MSEPTPVLPAAEAEKIEKVAETVEETAEVEVENAEEIIEKVVNWKINIQQLKNI